MQTVEEKISQVIDKVRSLKEEKSELEKKNRELEEALKARDQEIERLSAEKSSVKGQIEDLLKELDGFELK
ncbi:MAG TPA: cell division protein ZapB [Dissulfurispiraceae bacterium]|nr:cell division protein ZapB [Dissulfurispiraceae bacterium]